MFVGNGIRYVDFVFHPVGVFLEAQLFHVYRIVRVVVDSGHGTKLIESFDQHSFRIEIGKSERAGNMSHAPFFSPVFHCFDECGRYFGIVDKVYPSETNVLTFPLFVRLIIDNCSYTSYNFIVPVCEEIICFTEFECCVFLLVEGVEHVVIEVGHRVRVALVHSVIETDKFLKLSLCGDFLDCNSHISYL